MSEALDNALDRLEQHKLALNSIQGSWQAIRRLIEDQVERGQIHFEKTYSLAKKHLAELEGAKDEVEQLGGAVPSDSAFSLESLEFPVFEWRRQ